VILFVFENIHYVVMAEEILKNYNIYYSASPIPQSISKNCGITLKVNRKMKERVSEIFRIEGIENFRIFNEINRGNFLELSVKNRSI
jgi:hypothetical protein